MYHGEVVLVLLRFVGLFFEWCGSRHEGWNRLCDCCWNLIAAAHSGARMTLQLFAAAISPARDTAASYVAWGHSTLVSPWGEVVATTEEKEAIVYADVDMSMVDEVRQSIPVMQQRRKDVYTTVEAAEGRH